MIALMLLACISDRGVVEVPVHAVPSAQGSFQAGGADVQLEWATLRLQDVGFEEPDSLSLLHLLNPISAAHAHPGHELDGDLAGEILGTWTLDLLGEPVLLGSAQLFEGDLATAHFDLHQVELRGTATLDGTATPFTWTLDFDEEVAGIDAPLSIDADAPPASLCLSIDTAGLLSRAAWNEEPAVLENTLRFGALSTANYTLETQCSP